MASVPRVVLVTRASVFDGLLARHATREQARFFLETRGQDLRVVEAAHERLARARRVVLDAVPAEWRTARVDRDDLDRFLFEPEDIVVALGQDGLVANAAKYLSGQLVLGIDPDPGANAGVLVRHAPEAAAGLFSAAVSSRRVVEERTLVECALDDWQRLLALNEVFLGHRSHQTARYRLRSGDREERQMSSGVIVATGTGSTGWARSIRQERGSTLRLPEPVEPDLAFFVREAFPGPSSGTGMTEGRVGRGAGLSVVSEMDDGGTVFGDGIEADHLDFGYGVCATVRVAKERLRLLLG